jgi:DNA-binding NarL/FixJ family response regulator
MVGASPSPTAPICLLSPHPLVLDELRRMASVPGATIEAYVVELRSSPLAVPPITSGSVCVVDAAAPRPCVEGLIAAILSEVIAARILVLDVEFREQEGCALLAMGVKGFVRYADANVQLPRALAALAAGGFWAPRALVSRFLDSMTGGGGPRHLGASVVSRREKVVLDAVVENLTNKEIAVRLHISERTVKFHVSNLLAKFHVGRRADLLLLAHRFQPSVH